MPVVHEYQKRSTAFPCTSSRLERRLPPGEHLMSVRQPVEIYFLQSSLCHRSEQTKYLGCGRKRPGPVGQRLYPRVHTNGEKMPSEVFGLFHQQI